MVRVTEWKTAKQFLTTKTLINMNKTKSNILFSSLLHYVPQRTEQKSKTGDLPLQKTGELQLRKIGDFKFAIYTCIEMTVHSSPDPSIQRFASLGVRTMC